MDKHDITIYTTFISVDHAHHKILYAQVDKGGINARISGIFCKAGQLILRAVAVLTNLVSTH